LTLASGNITQTGTGTLSTGTGAVSLNGATTVSSTLAANGNTTLGDATTDRLTVTSQILGASPLAFQGTTDNGFASTFAFTDPTANRTITFGDNTGTVLLHSMISGDATATSAGVLTLGTGAVTSTKIFDDTITNSDINSAAAIAYSKLALTGTVVNADISASAAIAYSKLNLSNSLVAGDITSSAVTTAKIAKIALGSDVTGDMMYYDGTDWVRLGIGTAGQILTTNGGATAPTWVTWSLSNIYNTNGTLTSARTITNWGFSLTYDGTGDIIFNDSGSLTSVGLTSTGALSQTGSSTFVGSISQTGANTFSTGTGAITLNGATTLSGTNTLTVGTGATTLGGTLGVTGTSTLAAINTSGNFAQSGSTTFATGTGAITLNGATTLSGTNTLTVGTGATTLGGTLAVTGNQTNTGDLAVNGGDITTTATTFNLINGTATTVNFAGAATTINLGAAGAVVTGGGALTLASAAATSLTLDSGTTGALNIGTGANAKTIIIGNSTGATSLVLDAGTGAISLGSSAFARSTNIATGAALQTVTIGSTSGASTLTLDSGTGALNIGTGAQARSINIGTGNAVQNITMGNATPASTFVFNTGATTQTVFQINAGSITTWNVVDITGPSGRSLLRVKNDASDPLDDERVIIGQGGLSAKKPDALARDQLYVFGRINSSWDAVREDFLIAAPVLSADGVFGNVYWDESAGSNTRIQTVTSAGISWVARLDFIAAAANTSSLIWSNGINVTERSLNPVFEARVLGTNNNDHRIIAGFGAGVSGTAITTDTNQMTSEAFFRKIAAGTVWQTVTRSASGTETVNTTAVATNVYQTLRIEMNDTLGTADFYINGVLQFSHSTAVPTSALGLGYYIGNGVTGATSRSVDVDYIRVWSDDPADRADLLDLLPEGSVIDIIPETEEIIENTENQNLLETVLWQFAVDIQKFFASATEIVTSALLRVGELVTPKATVKELCLEGDDGETICLKKDDVKRILNSQMTDSLSDTGTDDSSIAEGTITDDVDVTSETVTGEPEVSVVTWDDSNSSDDVPDSSEASAPETPSADTPV
jgi:hypothetical protein